MATVSKAGRAANRKRKAELAKRPNLRAYYGRKLQDANTGAFRWRTLAIRPGLSSVVLDPYVDTLTWVDQEAALTGSLTLNRPFLEIAAALGVGYRIRLDVGVGTAGWETLWEMAMKNPETDIGSATVEVELEDDLAKLDDVKRDWSFRKTKSRGKGWYAHEIAAEVARISGIRVGRLARGTKRINKLVKRKATALDVIRAAYAEERNHTKQRFVLRLRAGKIEVIPLSRNQILYTIRDQFEGAGVAEARSRRPSTVIEARGRVGKGKAAKKVKKTVVSRAAARRLGRTVKEEDYGRVDSIEELERLAKRDLARAIRVRRSGTLTLPGIPRLRRGDCLRWITDEPGWHGQTAEVRDRSYVFASSVTQTLSADGLSTEVSVIQDDPYTKALETRDKEMRAAARARRKKRKAKK